MGMEITRLKLARVQWRSTLRVALVYRMVLKDTIQTISIELLNFKRHAIYSRLRKNEAKDLILVKCQK